MPSDLDLKAERDRFVAFSFCWSDIVLELDHNFNIVFAGGAIAPITGKTEEQLIGHPVTDVIAEADHGLFLQIVSSVTDENRIESVSLKLQGRKGPTPPVEVMGYRVKDLSNHLFIGMRLGNNFGKISTFKKDEESGLLDDKSFVQAAQSRIKQQSVLGENLEMTMLDMDQLQELANSLGNEDAGHLMKNRSGRICVPPPLAGIQRGVFLTISSGSCINAIWMSVKFRARLPRWRRMPAAGKSRWM